MYDYVGVNGTFECFVAAGPVDDVNVHKGGVAFLDLFEIGL